MDLGNYWQENKRFLVSVGVGVVAFAAAWAGIDSTLGENLRAQRTKKSGAERELRAPKYSSTDLDKATQEHEALVAACEALRKNLEFVARAEFRMDKGVTATSRYFTVVERTRDDLKKRAGRGGLALPSDLGMPAVAPTKEAELTRYLEALDAIEQTVTLAIAQGCTRIESMRVKLDPRLLSGKAFDDVEKTLVELRLVGAALPLSRLLVALQDPKHGRVLAVESCSIEPARTKNSDDVRLDLVLLLAHLNRVGQVASAEDAQ